MASKNQKKVSSYFTKNSEQNEIINALPTENLPAENLLSQNLNENIPEIILENISTIENLKSSKIFYLYVML